MSHPADKMYILCQEALGLDEYGYMVMLFLAALEVFGAEPPAQTGHEFIGIQKEKYDTLLASLRRMGYVTSDHRVDWDSLTQHCWGLPYEKFKLQEEFKFLNDKIEEQNPTYFSLLTLAQDEYFRVYGEQITLQRHDQNALRALTKRYGVVKACKLVKWAIHNWKSCKRKGTPLPSCIWRDHEAISQEMERR